ncbi:MAG: hypothetical protein HC912_04280, partial [Saprospiraceae bacterium]|nr:hypothetical protein [Saprospiraceae bacterium]
MAFIMTDRQGNLQNSYENIAIPSDFEIENAHIHGITHQIATQKGIACLSIMEQFMAAIEQSDLLIAHHAEYHKKV